MRLRPIDVRFAGVVDCALYMCCRCSPNEHCRLMFLLQSAENARRV